MNKKFDYIKDTRSAYRDSFRAIKYKDQHEKAVSWARFVMWRERLCLERALIFCNLRKEGTILDIPCGAGILGGVLGKFPNGVVASDISRQMIDLARGEYKRRKFLGFVRSDIAKTCFKRASFGCVIILGLMHRVPEELRKEMLKEISNVSSNYIIVSYSVDSPTQRLKHWIIKRVLQAHEPAPSRASQRNILEEFESAGLTAKKVFKVVRFVSSEVVFLLQRNRKSLGS